MDDKGVVTNLDGSDVTVTHLAAIYILLSVAAFQLDGIFIGASCTRQMCYGAIQSVLFFLLVCWMLVPRFEVPGLWWAMIVYVVVRAGVLFRYFPQMLRNCGD